jgi:hypothetical protein
MTTPSQRLKKDLQATFPSVKFSVKTSDHGHFKLIKVICPVDMAEQDKIAAIADKYADKYNLVSISR